MTARLISRPCSSMYLLVLFVLVTSPLAYPQVILTGAAWFSSTPTGATSVSQAYADGFTNTVGGDQWWDLWLALRPDASLPVNGPSDSQAAICIPLQAGNSYKYYIFAAEFCCTLRYSGLSLHFDGNSSTPGISVFGPVNGTSFVPDNATILSLTGNPVAGSGTSYYASAGVVAVLTEFKWNGSATPPGDVCQPFAFIPDPDGQAGPYGSFTIQVWPAASVSLSQGSGAPGTKLTLTGGGFAPNEEVVVYGGHVGVLPIIATAVTDDCGSFTVAGHEPEHPLGPMDVFAEGAASGKLGAATFLVTPGMAIRPVGVAPGGDTTAHVAGFGAGEIVDIYWNEPRQLLGAATTDPEGSGSATISIPTSAAAGFDLVIGVGRNTEAIALGVVRVQ